MDKQVKRTDTYYMLWFLMHRTHYSIYKAREKELKGIGISNEESAALFAIHSIEMSEGAVATPAEISRRLFRQPHSISGLIKRMENEGLVIKRKNLDRKNLVRVEITQKGQRALDQAKTGKTIGKIMDCLTDKERKQLSSCLEKLAIRALKEADMAERIPYLLL